MVVRIEKGEIPEPMAAEERAPLGRIGWIDVVMLAKTIEGERDGEDEEDREDISAQRRAEAGEPPDEHQGHQVHDDRYPTLEDDLTLQLDRIGGAFLSRRPKI